ncbi:hypothetical protein D3C86_725580 [compost metagenome]
MVFSRGKVVEKKSLIISRENPGTANQIEVIAVNRSASKAVRRQSNRRESKTCESISKLCYPNGFSNILNHVTAFFEFSSKLCFRIFDFH